MKTAAQWKRFYAAERARLGDAGLDAWLDRAPAVSGSHAAVVFPHTRLDATGDLTAAAALDVVRSGADEVLALGVLHGGRTQDVAAVQRARAGDLAARAAFRRVHDGSGALCAEEFSLDNFEAMLARASARAGRKPPRVHARYPFLVGDDPATVPGVDEVARLTERMPVVATSDPIHHGAGYGTPAAEQRALGDAATMAWAHERISAQLDHLANRRWPAFASLAEEVRSDFRDDGAVLGHVLGEGASRRGEILELRLVDYAAVLGAGAPTWVAGPLMRFV